MVFFRGDKLFYKNLNGGQTIFFFKKKGHVLACPSNIIVIKSYASFLLLYLKTANVAIKPNTTAIAQYGKGTALEAV